MLPTLGTGPHWALALGCWNNSRATFLFRRRSLAFLLPHEHLLWRFMDGSICAEAPLGPPPTDAPPHLIRARNSNTLHFAVPDPHSPQNHSRAGPPQRARAGADLPESNTSRLRAGGLHDHRARDTRPALECSTFEECCAECQNVDHCMCSWKSPLRLPKSRRRAGPQPIPPR